MADGPTVVQPPWSGGTEPRPAANGANVDALRPACASCTPIAVPRSCTKSVIRAPLGDVQVVPQPGVLRRDPPLGDHGRRLRDQQPEAAGGPRAQVHQVPVVRAAVDGRVLAHRRQPGTVGERGAAQGQRREEEGHVRSQPRWGVTDSLGPSALHTAAGRRDDGRVLSIPDTVDAQATGARHKVDLLAHAGPVPGAHHARRRVHRHRRPHHGHRGRSAGRGRVAVRPPGAGAGVRRRADRGPGRRGRAGHLRDDDPHPGRAARRHRLGPGRADAPRLPRRQPARRDAVRVPRARLRGPRARHPRRDRPGGDDRAQGRRDVDAAVHARDPVQPARLPGRLGRGAAAQRGCAAGRRVRVRDGVHHVRLRARRRQHDDVLARPLRRPARGRPARDGQEHHPRRPRQPRRRRPPGRRRRTRTAAGRHRG